MTPATRRTAGRRRASRPLAPPVPVDGIHPFLERLHARWHRPEHIGIDPLSHARRYSGRADREIVGFLASVLAYGNVRQIDASLTSLFGRMGNSPARFIRNFRPGRDDARLEGFYHRFNTATDIALLCHLLGQAVRAGGSIEGFWQGAQTPATREGAIPLRAAAFIDALIALDAEPYYSDLAALRRSRARLSFFYLLPEASGPSACKRLHMFLRWMIRPDDGVDLGLWESERPSAIEYPIDTHVHRIARYLGATRRNSADARTRGEVTAFFAALEPGDPVKYDFSLARIGILRECPRREELARCERCEIRPVCLRNRGVIES